MNLLVDATAGLLQQEEAAAETTDVDVVCSNQGSVCEVLYEWTDSELLAEVTSFIIGVPVKIILIAALALIANPSRFSVNRIHKLRARA